jgi:hypothetical protein
MTAYRSAQQPEEIPMPTGTRAAALALLLVASSLTLLRPPPAASAPPPGGDTPAKANEAASPRTAGLVLTGAVPPSTPAGSPVAVQATIENQGVELAWVDVEHAAPIPFDVKVTTKDGAAVPLTRYGAEVLAPTAMSTRLNDCILRKAKPGESLKLSVPNLGLYYDLTLPGEYLVVVGRGAGVGRWPSKLVYLTTAPIPFTVTRP